ncbi:SDR family oxidoreductase [Stenotrophomonas sp. MMGLT7]|uniref:SDR family oxidoreductase n=1 Tax=Stenotrophomonas sp. MMGLT7 TaxID=2901227 RepID=UPI001E4BFD05|nr:SDR family oxidoreductase [Stenotrophomonas sp. MMGLT7]MCD7099936.1 SDR family oxidoreductase [Stenotrophomonas sp. MMGLT7]
MATRKKTATAKTAAKKTTGKTPKAATATVVRQQRALQRQVDAGDRRRQGAPAQKRKAGAAQAGKRRQPVKMPAQHLRKPGNEHELELQPRFLAVEYQGSGKLKGMSAIVTGGDSGIGRAVAVLFAREGADVAIVYLDEHDDAQLTCEHVEKEGRRCLLIPGDVRDSAFCDAAVAQTVEAFGGLDVLVNNAAFQLHCDAIEELSDEHIRQTLETNIGGYFHMARAAVPHLRQGGSIVNSGSETGLFGSKSLLDYSATKGAIHAFTMALASQLQPRGIRVNAVAPGPVWTPLNPADKRAKDVAAFGRDSAMGRPAQPEELSPAYVFLASPVTASYVSGAVLPVMGGPHG